MLEGNEIINQLGALSYVGIWFIALISNIIIPVPEEFIILAFGYLAGIGHINTFIVIIIFISGLLVSDIVIYRLSRKGSKFVTWIYQRFFSKKMLVKNDEWIDAHMNKIIFFSRFLIQLRFLGPFIAGQRKVSQKRFIKYDFLALLIYVPLYVFLGIFFQNKIKLIFSNINIIKNITLVVIGFIFIYILFLFIYKHIFKSTPKKTNLR